jgi:hypothetical protein
MGEGQGGGEKAGICCLRRPLPPGEGELHVKLPHLSKVDNQKNKKYNPATINIINKYSLFYTNASAACFPGAKYKCGLVVFIFDLCYKAPHFKNYSSR